MYVVIECYEEDYKGFDCVIFCWCVSGVFVEGVVDKENDGYDYKDNW